MLVMHDWLGDHTNYDLILPYLNTHAFTWIFIDLRGYGLSRHHAGDFTCAEATEDVICLADRLGIDRFHVIGHSMSSMMAQNIATCVPERVLSAIAVTPLSASGLNLPDEEVQPMGAVAGGGYPIFETMALGSKGHYKDRWLGKMLINARYHSTPEARIGYMRMFLGTDFSARASGIRVPVRAIVGENDLPPFQKEAVDDAFRKIYPDFQLIECRKAGHYPMLQFPAVFSSDVQQLLFGATPTLHEGSFETARVGAQGRG